MTVISFISRSVMVLIWTFTDTHKHTHINNLSLHHEVCSSFYYFGFGFCLFIKSYFYDIALKSSQLSDKMSKPHTESSFNIILFFIVFDIRYMIRLTKAKSSFVLSDPPWFCFQTEIHSIMAKPFTNFTQQHFSHLIQFTPIVFPNPQTNCTM